MELLDAMCERHIQTAQRAGEFDNLPGAGKPLQLDDDSAVPEALRTGYRLLKNAGYLPPELALRKDALTLRDLLANTIPESEAHENLRRRLRMLELNLQQKGMSIDFLHGEYADRLHSAFSGERIAPEK
ncbi:DnaJ family domain-containing protein [Symbiopectobacterium purcellii]|uniref:DUF1992 domain-containing protein n=1 Tax=Symbiopectobacterium purcellii TaxID=2871826 RepID=A0ABX9ARL2_9ENTR|nr:DnaJ family domain-containing protein [Symbiopectobacterium purcellii]QZN95630.1 DUF1992 domain-containing protein [Symbiopectobacterium purcellii]